MEAHKLANLFPLMDELELKGLTESIHMNGQREPIILYEDQILDGRNRYAACIAANVDPVFAPFPGGDPLDFIVDHNLRRRHLTPAQAQLAAAEYANMKRGAPVGNQNAATTKVPIGPFVSPQEDQEVTSVNLKTAADKMGVSHTSVRRASAVKNSGRTDLIEDIKAGKRTVWNAYEEMQGREPGEKKPSAERNGNGKARPRRAPLHEEIGVTMWSHLKVALMALTNLPAADEVAAITKKNPRRVMLVDARVSRATKWLTEFSNAWNQGA